MHNLDGTNVEANFKLVLDPVHHFSVKESILHTRERE